MSVLNLHQIITGSKELSAHAMEWSELHPFRMWVEVPIFFNASSVLKTKSLGVETEEIKKKGLAEPVSAFFPLFRGAC